MGAKRKKEKKRERAYRSTGAFNVGRRVERVDRAPDAAHFERVDSAADNFDGKDAVGVVDESLDHVARIANTLLGNAGVQVDNDGVIERQNAHKDAIDHANALAFATAARHFNNNVLVKIFKAVEAREGVERHHETVAKNVATLRAQTRREKGQLFGRWRVAAHVDRARERFHAHAHNVEAARKSRVMRSALRRMSGRRHNVELRLKLHAIKRFRLALPRLGHQRRRGCMHGQQFAHLNPLPLVFFPLFLRDPQEEDTKSVRVSRRHRKKTRAHESGGCLTCIIYFFPTRTTIKKERERERDAKKRAEAVFSPRIAFAFFSSLSLRVPLAATHAGAYIAFF